MNKVAIIRRGTIIYLDEHATVAHPNETAARESRENQRVRYRAETLQKSDPDYWKVYKDQAENLSPELRRLLS